jgi:hypothetical protein
VLPIVVTMRPSCGDRVIDEPLLGDGWNPLHGVALREQAFSARMPRHLTPPERPQFVSQHQADLARKHGLSIEQVEDLMHQYGRQGEKKWTLPPGDYRTNPFVGTGRHSTPRRFNREHPRRDAIDSLWRNER